MLRFLIFLGLFSCTSFSDTLKPAIQKRQLNIMVLDSGLSFQYPQINKHLYFLNLQNLDTHGHGTHVTSIILKDACPEVKIIPCKYYDEKWSGAKMTERYKGCLRQAKRLKIDIINISGGGDQFYKEEYALFKNMPKTLIIAAAGNSGKNLNEKPYYPASYKLSNIRPIGAYDYFGSNQANWLIWEKGVNIDGLGLNGPELKTGTSMAAANYTNRLVRRFCQGLK